jgi:hypothetical protein
VTGGTTEGEQVAATVNPTCTVVCDQNHITGVANIMKQVSRAIQGVAQGAHDKPAR